MVLKVGGHVFLRPEYYSELRRQLESIEANARRHSDQLIFNTTQNGGRKWRVDSLTRLHTMWSHITYTLVAHERSRAITEWCPYPWFHLVAKEEHQKRTELCCGDGRVYTVVVGGTAPISAEYASATQGAGAQVILISEFPDRLEDVYLCVCGPFLLRLRLDRTCFEFIREVFHRHSDSRGLSERDRNRLFSGGDSHQIELELDPVRTATIEKLLLSSREHADGKNYHPRNWRVMA